MRRRQTRRRPVVVLALSIGASVVLMVARTKAWVPPLFATTTTTTTTTTSSQSEGRIEAVNAYGTHDGFKGAGSAYPSFAGRLVVEPYRETTLSYVGTKVPRRWVLRRIRTIEGKDEGEARTGPEDSAEWAMTLEELGDYVVSAFFDKTKVVETSIVCRYVRREIRDLSKADVRKYFGAFKILMDVDATTGRRLYGPEYRSLNYFVEIHLNLAGNARLDKLHDGLGFATQHMALTAACERSLQTVDPSIAVPYWDYTLDHHVANQETGREVEVLWSQPVWGDDMFGTATGKYKTMETGTFAYTLIPKNGTAAVRSPYGYLRAPWNCNKDPYLLRSHSFCGVQYEWGDGSLTTLPTPTKTTWPSCAVHWDFTFRVHSLYEWIWAAGYSPHGPVHFMIGGYTHCGDLKKRFPALDPEYPNKNGEVVDARNKSMILGVLKQMSVVFPKTLWRTNLVEYPRYCSDDTPQEECHMICYRPASDEGFREFATTSGASNLFGRWIDDIPDDLKGQFLEMICTTPWTPGEQLEAASPIDPSFWPIHPTMDRLLAWKRIVQPFREPAWQNVSGETVYCASSSSSSSQNCEGHHPWDLTYFETTTTKKSSVGGTFATARLTNAELYEAADPFDYKLPFVYDSFAWKHCDEEGHFFGTIGPNASGSVPNTFHHHDVVGVE
ncbi:hypothetical protein CTAYLR_010048 [Chrysophaeum taylorii]|uniref:Tyrosinase copper-binding domain-containing protein n=1 Tax=Chrysophaeum taylorii TaxID=2483200 RepID=A0AAD7U9P3_9STRA|nr:hypothetical protein CTAYLR_010048 [Chrysophaeum taylorii]